ncbi:MAG: hypothetical protein QG650_1181, partial [Patescibacteria group bacterium]|nr:hypothetical protein [Patescibacteria group bacterium]
VNFLFSMPSKPKFSTRLRVFAIGAAAVISCSISYVAVFSDESVGVFATVGSALQSPIVTAVEPNLPTISVTQNTYQTVSLTVVDSDNTGSGIVYTISTSTGVVEPQNGTAPVTNGTARVDFRYFAPNYRAKLVPVTVTLNDLSGSPVTVKVVNMYVSSPS